MAGTGGILVCMGRGGGGDRSRRVLLPMNGLSNGFGLSDAAQDSLGRGSATISSSSTASSSSLITMTSLFPSTGRHLPPLTRRRLGGGGKRPDSSRRSISMTSPGCVEGGGAMRADISCSADNSGGREEQHTAHAAQCRCPLFARFRTNHSALADAALLVT
jgi:hypothetical protein